MRPNSYTDKIIASIDMALRTVITPKHRVCERPNPSEHLHEAPLTPSQKKHIAGLMRVNHAGEVSAQALYQGQAATATHPELQDHLRIAAQEEIDHLAWCEQRLQELDSRPSILSPLWYGGSFIIGALAGLAGDQLSLGFLAETEQQVTRHLQQHLTAVPAEDIKTHAILEQMAIDETKHAQSALDHGGRALPEIIRTLMTWSSRLLTSSSYYL